MIIIIIILLLLPRPDCAGTAGPTCTGRRLPGASKLACKQAGRAGPADLPSLPVPGNDRHETQTDRHAPQRNATLRAAPRGPSGLPSAGQRLHTPDRRVLLHSGLGGREGAHGPHVKRGSSAGSIRRRCRRPGWNLPRPPPHSSASPGSSSLRNPLGAPRGSRSRPLLTCEARRRDETRRAAAPSAPPGSGCGHRK